MQVEVPSFVSLSEAEATDLLHVLGNASVYTPRLCDIPFAKWALLAISNEEEGKTGIIVQVHPTGSDGYLPLNLKLALIESGDVLQEIQSRSHDCYIQLNRFQVLPGANFSIRLVLGEFSITEDFVV